MTPAEWQAFCAAIERKPREIIAAQKRATKTFARKRPRAVALASEVAEQPPDAPGPASRPAPGVQSPRRPQAPRGARKARTVSLKGLAREARDFIGPLEAPPSVPRPRTRGECENACRPCPWVSCRHHLYLEAGMTAQGSLTLAFPELEPGELAETCSLDVADRDGITLEEVGELLNVTRERIRQVQDRALAKLASKGLDVMEPRPGFIEPDVPRWGTLRT